MIALKSVTKRYPMGDYDANALTGVNLEISRNEYVALTGPSGSGKSTLMHIIGCLDRPTEGEYHLNGLAVAHLDDEELAGIRNREVGFVFQNFFLFSRLTALDNVIRPLIYRGIPPRERKERARAALANMGLYDRLNHMPNQLSGGQRQRVAIARAMVGEPALLLADEPTGNLDSRTAAEVIGLFSALHSRGQTVVLVTHDAAVAANCHRVVKLHDGAICEDVRNTALPCT